MKFIIYKGQQKYTIDNAWLPDSEAFEELLEDFQSEGFTITSLQLKDIAVSIDDYKDLEKKEIEDFQPTTELIDGINWKKETVN